MRSLFGKPVGRYQTVNMNVLSSILLCDMFFLPFLPFPTGGKKKDEGKKDGEGRKQEAGRNWGEKPKCGGCSFYK